MRFFWLRSILVVACRNQQSGSNPTRARFIHNRVEFFFPLYSLCFYDNKNIFYKAVILNWTFCTHNYRKIIRTTAKQSVFVTRIHGLEMKKSWFCIPAKSLRDIWANWCQSYFYIYTHVYVYIRIYINYTRRSIAAGL